MLLGNTSAALARNRRVELIMLRGMSEDGWDDDPCGDDI